MKKKQKKSVRYRGSKTHGCGSMKKRRGKGNKGGAGRAGSGKRADQKKPSYWKEKSGRFGFKGKIAKPIVISINLIKLKSVIDNGSLKPKDGVYDIGDLGYDKLIGKGSAIANIKVKAAKTSKKVVDNFKKSGGEIILE